MKVEHVANNITYWKWLSWDFWVITPTLSEIVVDMHTCHTTCVRDIFDRKQQSCLCQQLYSSGLLSRIIQPFFKPFREVTCLWCVAGCTRTPFAGCLTSLTYSNLFMVLSLSERVCSLIQQSPVLFPKDLVTTTWIMCSDRRLVSLSHYSGLP